MFGLTTRSNFSCGGHSGPTFFGGGRTTIAARWVPMRPEDPDVRHFQWLRKRWEPAWRSIGETDGHNPEAGDLERLSVFRSTLRG